MRGDDTGAGTAARYSGDKGRDDRAEGNGEMLEPDKQRRTGQHQVIVIVDDESAIGSSMMSLLRKQRYTLHTFTHGADALEFLKHNSANLIISDMRMPEMDGHEFLKHCCSLRPESIRVLMSGYENKEPIINALDEGLAQYYIFKPWDDAALRQTIEEALRRQEEMCLLRLKEIVGTLTSLPPAPNLQTTLTRIAGSADIPVKDIVAEVEQNPALVAKLLRVANSLYFATRQHVTSVQDAVKLIGTEYVLAMAVSIEAFSAVSVATPDSVREGIDSIWERSIRRTALARRIAQHWEGTLDHSLLHIGSLLQDIGMVVRACAMPSEYLAFSTLCSLPSAHPYELERDVFGTTHETVGEAVLAFWNFPRGLCEIIGRHHGSVGNCSELAVMQLAVRLDSPADPYPFDASLAPMLDTMKQRLAM